MCQTSITAPKPDTNTDKNTNANLSDKRNEAENPTSLTNRRNESGNPRNLTDRRKESENPTNLTDVRELSHIATDLSDRRGKTSNKSEASSSVKRGESAAFTKLSDSRSIESDSSTNLTDARDESEPSSSVQKAEFDPSIILPNHKYETTTSDQRQEFESNPNLTDARDCFENSIRVQRDETGPEFATNFAKTDEETNDRMGEVIECRSIGNKWNANAEDYKQDDINMTNYEGIRDECDEIRDVTTDRDDDSSDDGNSDDQCIDKRAGSLKDSEYICRSYGVQKLCEKYARGIQSASRSNSESNDCKYDYRDHSIGKSGPALISSLDSKEKSANKSNKPKGVDQGIFSLGNSSSSENLSSFTFKGKDNVTYTLSITRNSSGELSLDDTFPIENEARTPTLPPLDDSDD